MQTSQRQFSSPTWVRRGVRYIVALKLPVVTPTKKKKKKKKKKQKKKVCVHPLTAANFLETERVEKLGHRKLLKKVSLLTILFGLFACAKATAESSIFTLLLH